MKHFLCLLLALLCLPLIGCQQQSDPISDPVTFYYRRAELTTGEADSVIAPCIAEGRGVSDVPVSLLNKYLKGPTDAALAATFPSGTQVLSYTVEGDHTIIVLNSAFDQLSGIDRTIACACITFTVMDHTGAASVTIRTENQVQEVTLDRTVLLLLDNYQPD